jgi:hypothetical protein
MGKIGKALGSISPLAGAITGQGLFGKLAGTGAMGLLPKMQSDRLEKKKKKKGDGAEPMQMAKGGKVKKKSKGDGCCSQGHTKGKMY